MQKYEAYWLQHQGSETQTEAELTDTREEPPEYRRIIAQSGNSEV